MVSGNIIGSLTLFFVNHVLDRDLLLTSYSWQSPWVYHTIYTFFVFLFNILDIVSFFLTLCSTIHLCAARQYFYNILFS